MSISQRIINERKRLLPTIPIALSLYIVLSSFARPGISADGMIYLQIARNIHSGIGLGWQASWVPPLHSCMIALINWMFDVQNLLTSSAVVGALMGISLVVAVWLLAEEVFGCTVALGASLVVALFPHFLWISKSPEAECTYTALLVFALWLLCVALRKQSVLTYILCGCVFAMVYLSRSEGVLVMFFVLIAVFATEGRRILKNKIIYFIAALLVSFFIVSSPYLMFLKRHYGAWVISPKSTYVLIWMKYKTYQDNDLGETSIEELWGLTKDGKLKWQVPSGISDLVGYLMSHPAKSARVYLNNIQMEVPGNIPNNSGMEKYPQVFPVIFALATIISIFRCWGDHSIRNKVVLLAPFMMILVLPIFTRGWWKYLVPYTPLLIIMGCAGIVFASETFFKKITKSTGQFFSLVVMISIAVYFRLLAFPIHHFTPTYSGKATALPHPKIVDQRAAYAAEQEMGGRWIAEKYGPGHNYMVRWLKLNYHLNGLWTAEPVADYEKLYSYAIRQGAEYYVVESDGTIPVEEIAKAPSGFRFDAIYRSPQSGYTIAIYRITSITAQE